MLLVFSAHAADFCSRAGGAIALYARRGVRVHVVDLTYGERGESENYWSGAGDKSMEHAKQTRAAEAQEAAGILGATIEFLDYGDYPLLCGRDRLDALARIIRAHRPEIILTHWKTDPFNVDHQETAAAVVRAATMAAVPGFDHPEAVHPFPHTFGFEPTIPRNEITGFVPDTYVDIGEVFETKMEALAKLRSQTKLAGLYTQWAQYRGAQASQWSGRPVKYAEAYQRFTAWVGSHFPLPGSQDR